MRGALPKNRAFRIHKITICRSERRAAVFAGFICQPPFRQEHTLLNEKAARDGAADVKQMARVDVNMGLNIADSVVCILLDLGDDLLFGEIRFLHLCSQLHFCELGSGDGVVGGVPDGVV